MLKEYTTTPTTPSLKNNFCGTGSLSVSPSLTQQHQQHPPQKKLANCKTFDCWNEGIDEIIFTGGKGIREVTVEDTGVADLC